MEAAAAATSLGRRWSLSIPTLVPSASLSPSKLSSSCSIPGGTSSLGFLNISPARWQLLHHSRKKNVRRSLTSPLNSSAADPSSDSSKEKWLLEPVGDGDWRHIGFKVPRPGAFEIVSDVVTVGRVPEKANLVIPVATVSGVHARLEKREGSLLVTDLDSTNGTFIDEKKLSPGAAATVPPGSLITFGDTHLAIFRVSKLEDESEAEEATTDVVTSPATESVQVE